MFRKLPKNNYPMGENSPNLVTLTPLDGKRSQGDQFGRIFAEWVIVFSGHFFNYKTSPHFRLLFPQLMLCINFEICKKGLGYILGDFSTTLSGHPERR
jgi:hypothetical protein